MHSTTSSLGVCLTEGSRVLDRTTFPPGRKHVEYLAPAIDDLTRRLTLDLRSIDGFGVAKGPGSFSGIRVGMALIKGLVLVLKKPVVGLSSLEILAFGALKDGEVGAAVVDARRKEVYTAIYAREGTMVRCLDQPRLIPHSRLGALADEFGAGLIITGEPPFWNEAEPVTHEVRQVDPGELASWCAFLADRYIENGLADSLHSLVPLYVRRSDAEEKRVSE